MPRKRWFVMIAILRVIVLMSTAYMVSAQTSSQPDSALTYSGRLADPSGKPVADGVYDFTFTLYASEKDNQALWSETQFGVEIKSGNVNVALGQIVPISKEITDLEELWLSVSVRGPQDETFTPLNPRQNLAAPESVTALTCPHSHFTDYWGGTNSSYGIEVDNGTGTGDGVRGYSASTVFNYAAVYGVNTATTGYGTGIYGYSNNGVGLYAASNSGDGLEATTGSTTKSAIYAHATNANGVWAVSTNKQAVHGSSTASYGVYGSSVNNFGIQTGGGGDASWNDLVGDLYLEGARGEVFTGGDVLEMYSNGFVVFDLDNNNNGSNQLEVWNGAEVLVFKVDENGNTVATGSKSASVNTADYGQRLLYAMESPEVWFEDFGSATLVNGTATVPIDSIFAETVNLKADYRIFLTPLGDCALYVAEKTPASFSVKAIGGQTCSISFDYRIVAKRAGYENERLSPVDISNNSRSTEAQP